MSEDNSYTDILQRTWDDTPDELQLPGGPYLLRANRGVYFAPREEGKNGRVVFYYRPQEPMEGVDLDDLAALGADYDISENEIQYVMFIEGNRDWRKVRRHVERHHGVTVTDEMTYKETLEAVANGLIVGFLIPNTFETQAGDTVHDNRVARFEQVED